MEKVRGNLLRATNTKEATSIHPDESLKKARGSNNVPALLLEHALD